MEASVPREGDGAGGLDKADTTDEPAVGATHRVSDKVAARLGDDGEARELLEVLNEYMSPSMTKTNTPPIAAPSPPQDEPVYSGGTWLLT